MIVWYTHRPHLALMIGGTGHFAAAAGLVVSTELDYRWRGKRGGWWLDVRYRYDADGTEYEGRRYNAASLRQPFGGDEEARAAALRLPPGTPLTIFYDPADPTRAVRSRDDDELVMAVIIYAAGLVVVPVLGTVWLAARWRRRSAAARAASVPPRRAVRRG